MPAPRVVAFVAAGLITLPLAAKTRCGDLRPAVRDGVVDVADAVHALRIATGLAVPEAADLADGDVAPAWIDESTVPATLTPQGSGAVDIADVVVILRLATGLTHVRDCGESPPRRAFLLETDGVACAGGVLSAWIRDPDLVPFGRVLLDGVPLETIRDERHPDWVDRRVALPEREGLPPEGLQVELSLEGGWGSRSFTLLPPCSEEPAVSLVAPAAGLAAGGMSAHLYGTNLSCVRSVSFVGTVSGEALPAGIAMRRSAERLVLEVPAYAGALDELHDIVVTSDCGSATLPSAYRYMDTEAPPDALLIRNLVTGTAGGSAAGGDGARLTGLDLAYADRVAIGPTLLTRLSGDVVLTAAGDLLIASMPPSPAGPFTTITVPVVASWGESASDPTPLTWTYAGESLPTCSGLVPTSGGVLGGTQVTLTGTGLGNVTDVRFGGVPAEAIYYPVTDGTQLVVVAPPSATATTVPVTLQSPAVASCGGAFTYVQ